MKNYIAHLRVIQMGAVNELSLWEQSENYHFIIALIVKICLSQITNVWVYNINLQIIFIKILINITHTQ